MNVGRVRAGNARGQRPQRNARSCPGSPLSRTGAASMQTPRRCPVGKDWPPPPSPVTLTLGLGSVGLSRRFQKSMRIPRVNTSFIVGGGENVFVLK